MRRPKRIVSLILVLCMGIQLCGFAFGKSAVAIDTEKKHVYKYVTVDAIITEFVLNEKAAEKRYAENPYLLIYGTVKAIDKNGKTITIAGNTHKELFECSCEKNVQNDVVKYSVGDEAALYAKLTVDLFKNKHITVERIVQAPTYIQSDDMYYALDGTAFDRSGALERTLGNGRVVYHIPSTWKDIEVNISENGLGIIEGYQYILNKMPGSSDVLPESLFVCYFDKSLLKDAADIKNVRDVERLIVENIDGSVSLGMFPKRTDTTYYGAKYDYYLGKYTDALETGKGYHTEYVFQEDKDHGIIVYLYFYREEKHISDVMFVTRFLEIVG